MLSRECIVALGSGVRDPESVWAGTGGTAGDAGPSLAHHTATSLIALILTTTITIIMSMMIIRCGTLLSCLNIRYKEW